MGLFDIFGKNDSKLKEQSERVGGFNEFNNLVDQKQKQPITFYYPKDYSDIAGIIDELKLGKSVVVDLTKVSQQSSKRIIDMLSGAIYALGGGMCEMQSEIYMFSPDGVEIK